MNTLTAGSNNTRAARTLKAARVPWYAWLVVVLLVLVAVGSFVFWGSTPSGTVLSDNLSVPLNGAKSAKIDISSDTGHLTIDKLTADGGQLLASGTLQYFEKG